MGYRRLLRKKIIMHIAIIFFIFLVVNFVGAGILSAIENLNYTDSFYLSISASTTTGFGDIHVTTNAGKWFISFYQLIGIVTFFYMIAMITVVDIDEKGLDGEGHRLGCKNCNSKKKRKRK